MRAGGGERERMAGARVRAARAHANVRAYSDRAGRAVERYNCVSMCASTLCRRRARPLPKDKLYRTIAPPSMSLNPIITCSGTGRRPSGGDHVGSAPDGPIPDPKDPGGYGARTCARVTGGSAPPRPRMTSRRATRPPTSPKKAPRGTPRRPQDVKLGPFLSENVIF